MFMETPAAFDTVDAAMLMDILQPYVGLEFPAFQWFLSYMTVRTHRVKAGSDVSSEVPCIMEWPKA